MARLNSRTKVKPIGHVDLLEAVDIVGSKLYSEQWTNNALLGYLPVIREKNKKTKKVGYYRRYYEANDDSVYKEQIKVPAKDKIEFSKLVLLQSYAHKEIRRLMETKLAGLISFKNGDAVILDSDISFLRTQYRSVFCTSFVKRKLGEGFEFGLVTVDSEKLRHALNNIADVAMNGQSNGDDYFSKLLVEFSRSMSEILTAEVGSASDLLPLFTMNQEEEIVKAVINSGLKADGSTDKSVTSERAKFKRPDTSALRKYAGLAIPKYMRHAGGVGRRLTTRVEAANRFLDKIGLDHFKTGSAGHTTNKL